MNQNTQDTAHHSKPIPISTQHLRQRSSSISSDSSSPTSSPPLLTPKNFPTTRMPTSSSSPVLHFLSQSPTKAPATFPFRGFPPVLEDQPAEDFTPPAHHRRGSTTSRFPTQLAMPDPHHERGVNVLRRLSLGGNLGKPAAADISLADIPLAPPNSAVSPIPPTNNIPLGRKARRSATITGNTRPHRAPSPMGERILKGHFDGFN